MRAIKDKNDLTLPLIDLYKDDFQGEEMIKACFDHGFFYIDNRQGQVVDKEIVSELESKSHEFFNLPSSEKKKFAIENSMSLTGFVDIDSTTDFVSHINEIFVYHSEGLFPKWKEEPVFPYVFGPPLTQYVKSCLDLNYKIFSYLAPYFELKSVRKPSDPVNNWMEAFDEQAWTARFLRYPGKGGTIAPHNDVGLLTILNQDLIGGLQVWLENSWHDVLPIKDTFVVNVGEMLSSWSSGLLKSTRHRVLNSTGKDRYSMTFLPLFDKQIEVFDHDESTWKYPYRHLAERYYNIYKHLADSVQNPETCLEGKTPKQVEKFHQETFLSKRS